MLQEENAQEDVEVTWEDQANINKFAKLNSKMSDLEEDYEEKKKDREYLEDLEQELELADEDEPVRYRIGDAFIHMSLESAQEKVVADKDQVVLEIEGLKNEMDDLQTDMDALKKVLYARFGKSINLEK
ncbi:Prefoldin, subunit 4 [Rhizoclosmatium globosum]|uniref:Prefoldin subunit 4 n=1 Tax=Rhizoclosmatium globosum TaxID=329046 RepID=A0A1Y2C4V2_9FUNG|nr:Prefoldin, subunit 4 [Rhizoclosmatium globosum]|eukprot:ORY42062.1 Prefoldin, subunit 4 [Rhizoclosmatium globosum]